MAVPYTFGSATAAIPLSQLDSNFATTITLGNTAVQLGNTITNLTGVSNLASASALSLGSNGNTTAVTIDTSQNVGIGTSSPTSKLTVNGLATLNNGVTLNDYGNIGATSNSAGISLTGGSVTNNGGQINLRGGSFSSANNIEFIQGGTERMRIDSSGNVGIGTSSPATKFQVSGTSGSLNARINAGNTGLDITNNDSTGVVNLATSPLSVGGKVMSFTTYNGSSSAEAMRIDSSGNLLVGTTSTFDNVSFLKVQSLGGVSTKIAGTSLTSQMSFFNDNGRVGYIGTSGSTTSYNTSSDYRLKENIAPMTGALAKVVALKPVTYTWKANGSDGQGFIAHELQAVVPDCVTGEKDAVDTDGNPIYQGIDTSFLVATLTAALQEAHGLIKDLQVRVNALEAK